MNCIKIFLSLFLLYLLPGNTVKCPGNTSAPDGNLAIHFKRVEILNHTRQLTIKTVDDTTKLTIITGDVRLRQGNTLFYCDSCVMNNNTNIFEAWGHVHINDSDTANIYSNHLRYLSREKLAYLDGNVRLN